MGEGGRRSRSDLSVKDGGRNAEGKRAFYWAGGAGSGGKPADLRRHGWEFLTASSRKVNSSLAKVVSFGVELALPFCSPANGFYAREREGLRQWSEHPHRRVLTLKDEAHSSYNEPIALQRCVFGGYK